MLLQDLLALLRSYAPEESALPNDPVGLLIDPVGTNISSVVVCLDATASVASRAAQQRAELIIAHHPLIYHPLRRLSYSDPISSVALSLVKNGIGLYAMHTNWDAAQRGINDTLADCIGLIDICPLGAEKEAALARIGRLADKVSAAELLERIRMALGEYPTSTLRIPKAADPQRLVETIAVCGGAGSMLAETALQRGAQAFVTADVRHHEFVDAASRGLLLIDAGHEATEVPGMKALAMRLSKDALGLSVSFVPNWPS